jgi:hypothetical protein
LQCLGTLRERKLGILARWFQSVQPASTLPAHFIDEANDRLEFSETREGIDVLSELELELQDIDRRAQITCMSEPIFPIAPGAQRGRHDDL